jgi:hypothetical protein
MIRISLKNWDKLRMLGHHPETFDDIISKVLENNDGTVLKNCGENE